jgi:hypothetical protein
LGVVIEPMGGDVYTIKVNDYHVNSGGFDYSQVKVGDTIIVSASPFKYDMTSAMRFVATADAVHMTGVGQYYWSILAATHRPGFVPMYPVPGDGVRVTVALTTGGGGGGGGLDQATADDLYLNATGDTMAGDFTLAANHFIDVEGGTGGIYFAGAASKIVAANGEIRIEAAGGGLDSIQFGNPVKMEHAARLMDGVARFANVAQRDAMWATAVGSLPVEGMLCYLQDTNAYQMYDGIAWVPLVTGGTGDLTQAEADALYVNITGDAMTGGLSVAGTFDVVSPTHVSISNGGAFYQLEPSGTDGPEAIIGGNHIYAVDSDGNPFTPTAPWDVATKGYVDSSLGHSPERTGWYIWGGVVGVPNASAIIIESIGGDEYTIRVSEILVSGGEWDYAQLKTGDTLFVSFNSNPSAMSGVLRFIVTADAFQGAQPYWSVSGTLTPAGTLPVYPAMGTEVRVTTAITASGGLDRATADGLYVQITGDTMTGNLHFTGGADIVMDNSGTNSILFPNGSIVGDGGRGDISITARRGTTGDLMLEADGAMRFATINDSFTFVGGPVWVSGSQIKSLAAGVDPSDAVNKEQMDAAVAAAGGISQAEADGWYVNVAGDAMTGALTLPADPTSDYQASTKRYVDSRIWYGSQAQYDAIVTKDPSVLYCIGV